MLPLVALLAVGAALSACTATAPEPTETALFSDEDEAFAAAEATYRAYVDALNAVDLSDPDTFEDVYAWTTGEANADERKTLSQMHADSWTVDGETVVVLFAPDSLDASDVTTVHAVVCTDVGDVEVKDSSGASVVSPDRPSRYSLQVIFTDADSPTGFLISESTAIEDTRCEE